jgi:hypothetical protein
MVESCGLTHDEILRATELPLLKASSDKAALGGCEERFEGPNTHFVKPQGAGQMLGQSELAITPAAVTIPKNNWLKNLWAVAGTALADREMQKCEAIMAPTFMVHADPKPSNAIKIVGESGPRFTYQRRASSVKLAPYVGHENTWKTKGKAVMKVEKHSRFSAHGTHFKKGN